MNAQQQPLDFTPRTERVVQPVDPNLVREEKPRLSRQSREIVDRLRLGPATNRELSELALRFGARIKDCREAGYVIDIISRDHVSGLVVYQLISEPETTT